MKGARYFAEVHWGIRAKLKKQQQGNFERSAVDQYQRFPAASLSPEKSASGECCGCEL